MNENHEAIVQFNIRSLLVVMAFVALTCTAFVSGAEGWEYVFDWITLLLIGGGLVASVATTGSRRVFWFALVVFTSLYLAATHRELAWLGMQDGVLTSEWIGDMAEAVHPRQYVGDGFHGEPVFTHNYRSNVASRVGFQAIAIFVGVSAAYISRAIFIFSQRRDAKETQHNSETKT